ncbi:hypothetical protein Hanom_Chr04g00338611 [Helianthus anomalus]
MKPNSHSIYKHLGNQIYKTAKRTRLTKQKRSRANCWRNRCSCCITFFISSSCFRFSNCILNKAYI